MYSFDLDKFLLTSYILHIPKSARPLGHHRRPHSHLPPSLPVLGLSQGLTQFQACPFSWCCPPISFFVCLLLSVPALCLVRLSWQDFLTLLHVHTTSVCVFSLWSGGHQKARWIIEFVFLLPHWWCGLCTRCRGLTNDGKKTVNKEFWACLNL